MKIFPAIDLKDGKCVHLVQGDYNQLTIYNDDPISVAKDFKKQGAKFIHLVDLDGAKEGYSINGDVIRRIAEEVTIDIEVGGGIRTLDDIERVLSYGVTRVILGSIAIKDFLIVERALKAYGSDKIVVGVDAKCGYVAINGWLEVTNIKAFAFCKRLEDAGLRTVIYTDIAKDGMMQGVNLEETKFLIDNTNLNIIASGGIANINDIKAVFNIGAYGVILGKSLYQKAVSLKEVIKQFEVGDNNAL